MLDSFISDEQMFKIVTPQKLNSFHCAYIPSPLYHHPQSDKEQNEQKQSSHNRQHQHHYVKFLIVLMGLLLH